MYKDDTFNVKVYFYNTAVFHSGTYKFTYGTDVELESVACGSHIQCVESPGDGNIAIVMTKQDSGNPPALILTLNFKILSEEDKTVEMVSLMTGLKVVAGTSYTDASNTTYIPAREATENAETNTLSLHL